MIHYLGSGTRYYGERPIPLHARANWEFQAVVNGSCAPRLPQEAGVNFRSKTLWVFPPGSVHGWTGYVEEPCDVIVFHVDDVPVELTRACIGNMFVSADLDETCCAELRASARSLQNALSNSDPLVHLLARTVIDRMVTLLFEQDRGLKAALTRVVDSENAAVRRGLAYYAEHMSEGVGLSAVAEACGYSAGHLRRMFRSVLQRTPREVFAEYRHERARSLLTLTTLPIDQVAEACGYSDSASFSRAFHAYHRASPTKWRAERPTVNAK